MALSIIPVSAPVIGPGVATYSILNRKNRVFLADSGRTYSFWRQGTSGARYSYSNDTLTWSTPIALPGIAVGRWLFDVGFNGTHFAVVATQSGDADNLGIYTYADTATGLSNIDADGGAYAVAGGQDVDDVTCDMTNLDNIWVGFHLDSGGGDDDPYVLRGHMVAGSWVDYAGFPDKLDDLNQPLTVSIQAYGVNSAKVAVFETTDNDLRIWDEASNGATVLEFTDADVQGLGADDLRLLMVDTTQWVTFSGDEFFNSTGGGVWVAQGRVAQSDSAITIFGNYILQFNVGEGTEDITVGAYTRGYGFRLPFIVFENIGFDGSDNIAVISNSTVLSRLLYTFSNATSRYIGFENYTYSSPPPTVLSATAPATVSKDEWVWLNVTVQDLEGHGLITYVDTQVNTTGDQNNFTLRWTQTGDVFSELSDLDGIVTLNASSSISAAVNATTMLLSMNITMTGGQSGPCDVRVTLINLDTNTGTQLFPSLFIFSIFNWNPTADLIDSAFEQFGIIGYLTSITTWISGLVSKFETSLTRVLALILLQFTVIEQVYGFFTGWATSLFAIALTFSTFWQSIMDGTSPWVQPIYNIGNFWNLIGYNSWAPAVPMLLFIWWLDSIPRRAVQTVGGEIQVFINDLNTAIGLISYFVSIFSYVANTIIDRVYGLFPAIT